MIKRDARPLAARLLWGARRGAGLSQRALALRAKVPQPTIAAIESGRQDPRFMTLSSLIHSCGQELAAIPRPGEGIDRTQIEQMLRLTPEQRLRSAGDNARALRRFLGTARR
ncbi:MAG: helix-turn-helix domain-containing protein [Chloroflexota bacterium]|nr:helix-turn-helix domain-containing protein [Chloroflexota bacterium]